MNILAIAVILGIVVWIVTPITWHTPTPMNIIRASAAIIILLLLILSVIPHPHW